MRREEICDFLDRAYGLVEKLDWELSQETKNDLVGYLIHPNSRTFGVVVKKGKSPDLPYVIDNECISRIIENDVQYLKSGYIIISPEVFKDTKQH